ncbi:MAG: hypothetical protein IH957_11740 [Chloroflexi bacterium]|nr:hypothetical protein [Chloroflexota bacterium]
MRRSLIVAVVSLIGLLAIATVASADHAWSAYHFPSDNLNPTVVDKTSSSLYDVTAGVQEWAALGTPIQPQITTAKKGDITVTEAFSPFWLGLARIFIDGDHITKGEVKLNTKLLDDYPAGAADHVLCQEIGHVLGLNHNRDGAQGGSPDDTCMNDQVNLFTTQYTSPNSHDTDQLNANYNHIDPSAGGDDGGGGGGCPPGKPDHPKCSASEASGHWVTVHVFWVD